MLGPITSNIIEQVVQEAKKQENVEKIQECIFDPLFSYIQAKIYTYLQYLGLLMALIIVLLIIILIVILRDKM